MLRLPITTRAPSRPNASAVARPIPEPPPVTNATLPSNSFMSDPLVSEFPPIVPIGVSSRGFTALSAIYSSAAPQCNSPQNNTDLLKQSEPNGRHAPPMAVQCDDSTLINPRNFSIEPSSVRA